MEQNKFEDNETKPIEEEKEIIDDNKDEATNEPSGDNVEESSSEDDKKSKIEKGISMAKFYSLATQGIINMAVMAGLGYLIGYFTFPNTPWPVIFAIVGLLCGLVTFISYVLYLSKGDSHVTKNKS